MTDYSQPLVSIIIPTYNEEEDIEACLRNVFDLEYGRKEIIVVDDCSRDGTVGILQEYERQGRLVLLQQGENRGVAAARNRGIREAKGEIVILLNADVVLEKDFILRILPHYEKGADFVVCNSWVKNTEYLIPAYLQSLHAFHYGHDDTLVWSEGFSCRRSALLDVGLFDEGFPGCSGEDAALGMELDKRFKRVLDKSVAVSHIASHTLSSFWRERVGRGRGNAYFQHLYRKKNLSVEIIRICVLAVLFVVLLSLPPINFIGLALLVIILLERNYRLVKAVEKGCSYIIPFSVLSVLDYLARKIGMVRGYREIIGKDRCRKLK